MKKKKLLFSLTEYSQIKEDVLTGGTNFQTT